MKGANQQSAMVYIIVAAALFAGFAACWAALPRAAAGQETAANPPPHRIEWVDSAEAEAESGRLLQVGGVLSPDRFPDVVVTPLQGTAFSIEIPQAMADPELGPSRTFPGQEPLLRVEISAVADPQNPEQGVVILVVQVAPGNVVKFLPADSTATEMTFSIAPPAAAGEMAMAQSAVDAEEGAWAGRPTRVRVAVLNASGVAGKATEIGLILGDMVRRSLEGRLGQRLELVNISNAAAFDRVRTVVQYRPGFLRAALLIARRLPGDQYVEPTPPHALARRGIDVEILLGTDLP